MSKNSEIMELDTVVVCGGDDCHKDPHDYDNRHEHQSDSGQGAGSADIKHWKNRKNRREESSGNERLEKPKLSVEFHDNFESAIRKVTDFRYIDHPLPLGLNLQIRINAVKETKELLQKGGLQAINNDIAKQKNVPFNINLVGVQYNILSTMPDFIKNNTATYKDDYEAINKIMEAYKEVYEKSIEPRLAQQYQRLSKNFQYTQSRVSQAQKRYQQFMQGKRFRLSPQDQKVLSDLENIKKISEVQKSAKALVKVSKVFGLPAKAIQAYELLAEFNKAQRTGNWVDFHAKIGEMASGMLIGSLVALALPISLPSAVLASVLGAVASYYLDEAFWRETQLKMKSYLE